MALECDLILVGLFLRKTSQVFKLIQADWIMNQTNAPGPMKPYFIYKLALEGSKEQF